MTALRDKDPYKPLITDKIPGDFRFIGLTHPMFLKSKIIHCVRDPRAVCLSIFSQLFTGDNLYADLLQYWYQISPCFILDIRYEDLTYDPEIVIYYSS